MDASSQPTLLHVQAHVFHVPDHLGCHSHPTEKAAGGQGLVGNSLDVRHFSRLLFQNVNTLSHFRTRAPAKTLNNKLHKHLWGGWSCHITASTWRCGGGVASRTQSGAVHKPVHTRLTEPGVQENTSPWAPQQAPAWGRSQSWQIISQTSLLPSLKQSQGSVEESSDIRARPRPRWGFPGAAYRDVLNSLSPTEITSLTIPTSPRVLFNIFAADSLSQKHFPPLDLLCQGLLPTPASCRWTFSKGQSVHGTAKGKPWGSEVDQAKSIQGLRQVTKISERRNEGKWFQVHTHPHILDGRRA